MGFVMVHPDLPGQPIDVANPRAIEIHERAGWHLVDEKQRPSLEPLPGPPPPDGHVEIYNPVTRASAFVPPESVGSYRVSGWLTRAEHEANEKEAAARAAAAQQEAAAKAPASDKSRAAKAAASKEE